MSDFTATDGTDLPLVLQYTVMYQGGWQVCRSKTSKPGTYLIMKIDWCKGKDTLGNTYNIYLPVSSHQVSHSQVPRGCGKTVSD